MSNYPVLLMLLPALLATGPVPARAQDVPIPVVGAAVDSNQVDIALFEGDMDLDGGDYQGAIGDFRRALALDPDRFEAHLLLARSIALAMLNDAIPAEQINAFGSEALRHFRWILVREPENEEALQAIRLLARKFIADRRPAFTTERGRVQWEAGDRAMNEGDYEEAVRAFREALKAEPETRGLHRSLAEAYLRSGEPRIAISLFRKELVATPEDFKALGGLGRALLAAEDTARAVTAFKSAFEIDDSYEPAVDGLVRSLGNRPEESLSDEDAALLGRAQVAARNWNDGERLLSRVHERAPTPRTDKALAIAKYYQSKTREALTLLEDVHRRLPGDSETLFYLGASHLRVGEKEEGRLDLKTLLENDPTNPNALRLLGLSLSDEPGREEESMAYLLRARDMGAKIENLSCILGLLNMRLDRPATARGLFQDCLGENPDYAPAYLALGVIADDAGRKGEAIARFEQYMQHQEPPPGILVRLGVDYLRVGREEDAYRALGRVPSVGDAFDLEEGKDPTPAQLLEMAGFYLSTVRSLDDAIFVGEKLLSMDTNNAVYNNNLAMVYADADSDAVRAHELAVKANRLAPDNPGHLDTLGWTLIRLGRYVEADTTFQRVLSLAKDRTPEGLSEIYYHMGVLYDLMNRPDDAKRYLELALESPPTPQLREAILEQLKQ